MNRGVPALFLPDNWPEVGQCLHKMVQSPTNPDWLFQQNHCGVYRSRDAGDSWEHIEEGLPGQFIPEIDRTRAVGFPMVRHPRDPETIYVVPIVDEAFRAPAGGEFKVYRSRNGGTNWEPLTNGLPQENGYLLVSRRLRGRHLRPGRAVRRDHGWAPRWQPRRGRLLADDRGNPAADHVGGGGGSLVIQPCYRL